MSVRVMSYVWDLDIPASEKLVLLVIADHASDDGDNAWPSLATIARKASIGERQVRRIIRALEERGLLRTSWNAGGTPDQREDRRPNRYRVIPNGGTPMTARASNGGTSTTPRGDMEDTNGGSPMSANPSNEPPIEPSILPAHPGGTIAVVPSDAPINAQHVVQAFVDEFRATHNATPPTQTLARVGRDARVMLERGEYDPPVLVSAARDAARFGHANLASAVTAVLSERTRPRRGGPATASDRIADLMPLIEGTAR